MTEKHGEVKPGDWVRFMDGGRPVIGAVLYVRVMSSLESRLCKEEVVLTTDVGTINIERVLETRSAV